MQYLVATNNVYSHMCPGGNILWDSTHFCPAAALTPAEATQFWVFPMTETARPAYNLITQGVEPATPISIGGVWTQQWSVVTLPLDTQKANSTSSIQSGVTVRLDDFARQASYVNIQSLITYVGDPNPKYNTDGLHGRQSRSDTWITTDQIVKDVQGGLRAPCSYTQIELELPELIWPVPSSGAIPGIYR